MSMNKFSAKDGKLRVSNFKKVKTTINSINQWTTPPDFEGEP